MCYKFERIISSYLDFSKLEKNSEGVPIYLVKLKILSFELHKYSYFWLFLRCLLKVSDYLFWWLLRKRKRHSNYVDQLVSFNSKLQSLFENSISVSDGQRMLWAAVEEFCNLLMLLNLYSYLTLGTIFIWTIKIIKYRLLILSLSAMFL